MWFVGVFAYIVTVACRTSIGVASVQAGERFELSAATLSLFGVVQLGTYAAGQFPAGLLLDRFGPRALLTGGLLVMLSGQLMMAFGTDFSIAATGRLLLGAGDAAIFISALRLVAEWFPTRRVPFFTQVTGVLGQLGQVVSAIPFFALLVGEGWRPAFLLLAMLLVAALIGVLLVLKERPQRGTPTLPRPSRLRFRSLLGDVLKSRGPWTGMFAHWISLSTVNAYVVMWGVPFLTQGHGLTSVEASTLLTLQVLVQMILAPVCGALSGRFPDHRAALVGVGVGVHVAIWVVVLAIPGPHSFQGLVPLACGLAIGAAVSGVGFDIAREGVPARAIGTATGFVNVGGFGAGLLCVLASGVVLDLRTHHYVSGLSDYRVALAWQGAIVATGVMGFLIAGRKGGSRPRRSTSV